MKKCYLLLMLCCLWMTGFAQDHSIAVSSNVFTPSALTISVGETVEWTNMGGNHNVNGTSATYPNNPESFGNGGASTSTWTYQYTFNTPGEYTYQCDPHVGFGMVGTISVMGGPAADDDIVITEIMYNSPESGTDSLEFIEVYNNGNTTADLNGWSFAQGVVYTFEDVVLAAGEYYVVCVNASAFEDVYGMTAVQWEAGALTNGGETIELVDASGNSIDMVTYDDAGGWPLDPDGGGASLVLCDVNGDNTDPLNWSAAPEATGVVINGVEVFASPFAASDCEPNNPPTYPAYDIADVVTTNADGVADSLNVNCSLTGIVHGINFRPSGLQFVLIDGTDGISLFSDTDGLGYTVAEGDEITVEGTIGQFSGLTQIIPISVTLNSDGNALVTPTVIAGAFNESMESDLVRLEDVSLVDAAQWTGTGTGFNIDVTDGTNTWAVRIDADTDLYGMPAPTGTFNVTGLGSQFDAQSPFDEGYQLLPRYVADIDPYNGGGGGDPTFPDYDIATVTTVDANGVVDSLGVTCTLTGVVHGGDFRGGDGVQFTFIDATGGIGLFGGGITDYEVTEGDEVTVRGTIGQFNGLTQINPEEIILNSQGNDLNNPMMVNTFGEDTESELIRIADGVNLVDPAQWTGMGSGFNVDVTDGLTTYTLRIDADTDAYSMPAPTGLLSITGIGGQFDNSEPYDEGYQLFPRYMADIVPFVDTEENELSQNIRVYPNPTSDVLHLDFQEVTVETITMHNVFGQQVLALNTPTNTIDVADFPQGIYLVTFQNGALTWTTQVVVQH